MPGPPMSLTSTAPRIAFHHEGSAGPPVLLIMGFGMSGEMWRPQIDGLSRAHRVAFYDHLGVGGSEAPWRRPTMRRMAADATRVLDALSWASAHVVGVSMGGMIAQELALRHPTRVKSLTLVATHAGGALAALPRLEGLARFVKANTGTPTERIAALKQLLYTPEFLASGDGARLDARMAEMAARRAPRETVLGHLGAVLRHRTRRRLDQLDVPTLVVRPDQDILVRPANSDVLAASIRGARLVCYEDAGHGITFQRAESLNEEIARHVADVERRWS